MRRLTIVIAAAAVAVAVGLCSAPADARTLKSIWGPRSLPGGVSTGPIYRDLGVDDLQVVLRWSSVARRRPANPRNPRDSAYRWDKEVEATVAFAKRWGLGLTIMIKDSPPWANGGRSREFAPARARDYADFAYAAASRYRSVRRWMIWGEPSRASNWRPLPKHKPTAPRRYALLLDAAYAALKRVNARNVVIGGMTFTAGEVTPAEWLRWMRLPNGKPPRLDAYGHNAFSTRIPNLAKRPFSDGNYDFSDLDTLHAAIARVYRVYPRFRTQGPKIWVSEFTIQAEHGSLDFNFFVSAKEQARWVTAAYREANRAGYVLGVGWLGLLDEPRAPYNRTTGLLRFEGGKKPAYFAYKRVK